MSPLQGETDLSGATVLDLGAGAGLDAFLAAERVGTRGRVIGVDQSPLMVGRARANAIGHSNVEFRLGRIEHLPVADASVDLVISNCVINLVTDKLQVFRDAFRVLKRGGRLRVSDTVLVRDLPPEIAASAALWACCIVGAVPLAEYVAVIGTAGFTDVRVLYRRAELPAIEVQQELGGVPVERLRGLVESVTVCAIKTAR
jgi:SAM-dependent methyltransferase